MSENREDPVQVLILGAGWTSTFLIPLLDDNKITHAATTSKGDDSSIPFEFDPESDDPAPFLPLPSAKTVLITFPIKGTGGSKLLVTLYMRTHQHVKTNFIQLGTTGIWPDKGLHDRFTIPFPDNPRKIAEDELLSLGGTVLNLAGLWGGKRDPRNWVGRVAPDKEELAGKGSLHLIHGWDVARAIIAVHEAFTPGERWLITDLRIYDWWDLASAWDEGGLLAVPKVEMTKGKQAEWVQELMVEKGIKSLPRPPEQLKRGLNSLHFWKNFGIMPSRTLVSGS